MGVIQKMAEYFNVTKSYIIEGDVAQSKKITNRH